MSGVKHSFAAEVVERDVDYIATMWAGRCGRHKTFAGPSYEYVEDKWRQHVYETTGQLPNPMGSKEGRWQPEEATS